MLRQSLSCFLSILMSVLLPFEALCAPAQQAVGGITGVVRDEKGAVVPEARITLTLLGSQRREFGLSGATGQFTFQSLPAGDYIVTVAKAGSALLRLEGIAVKPGQSTEIQPVLSTSDLRRQLLLIPAGTVIEVMVQQNGSKKITGKLGSVTDEGFEVQTVKSGKISSEKVAFADVESVGKKKSVVAVKDVVVAGVVLAAVLVVLRLVAGAFAE